MPPASASLSFRGLVRHFGRLRVLDGVDGSAGPGDLLLVRGANGAGKSTLLRCLAGLLRPQAGEVRLRLGDRELDAPERRLAVGYVAPDLALYETLTARENLAFFSRLRRLPADAGDGLLSRLGVPSARPVGALSSGQRQRLRWAWALLHAPASLLLDEPFQNLDLEGETLLREVLEDHRRRGGLAVVATPSGVSFPEPVRTLDLPLLGELR